MKAIFQIAAILAAAFVSQALTNSITCNPSPLELVFAIDLSSSLELPNFKNLQIFLKSVADEILIGPENIRPAVISFSTNVTVEVALRGANDVETFKNAIDAIPYYRGMTATGLAMQTARRTVFSKSRPGASKLLVVVTDGRANEPGGPPEARKLVKAESAELRSQGVRIHAIGIGEIWLREELEAIAGSDDFSMINKYEGLKVLIDSLVKDICKVQCTNLGTQSFAGQCFNGTQRIVHVTNEYNKQLSRCEKSITYEYKYCGNAHLCKDLDVSVGDCVRGVREVVTTWEDFDINKQTCNPKRSVQQMDCSTIQECKEPVAEILFLLDGSESIDAPNWKLQLNFVHHMVSDMKVASDAIRVGVIVFGREASNEISLGFVPKANLLRRILRLNRKERQNTNTGDAIRLARSVFASQSRPGVSRIAILMTDGESNTGPNAIKEAAKLESDGVTIIVIGVGEKLTKKELEAIATPTLADHLFYADDYDKLMNWAERISKETCESITPPDPSLCDLPPKRVVSSCYNGLQKVTEVKYEYDAQGRCTKKTQSDTTASCKVICTDPINGNQYNEGETWQTECSSFVCRRPASHIEVLRPKTQECPGADKKCYRVNSSEDFRCHDERGRLYERCHCLAEKGSALLRVITADASAKP